jgi:hypothetical protein
MPKLEYIIKEYDAEELANDWNAKSSLARQVWSGVGLNIADRLSDEEGKYHEIQFPGLNNPLEFAIEFHKVNATETDIGYRAETLLVAGQLEVHISVVRGLPKNVCSGGRACGCNREHNMNKDEDPC